MASIFKKTPTSKTWTISYFNECGRRVTRSSGTSDKAAARRIGAKWESEVALRKSGIIDPRLEKMANAGKQSIRAAFDDYRAYMRSKGSGTDHIDRTETKTLAIAKACQFNAISDIDADKVNSFVGKLKDAGRSVRTCNAYIQSIRGFSRWLAKQGKLSQDPLVSLSKPNPETDRRLVRRYLTPDEWRWLDATTRRGDTRFGLTGIERATLYSLAIQTGLRSGEIRSLTRGNLHLTGENPFVMADAGSTKNKRTAKQHITKELARELLEHMGKKLKGVLAFHLPHETTMGKMLRADLEAARQAWLQSIKDPQERLEADESDFLKGVDSNGDRIDFHALRHTTASWLLHNGCDIQTTQRIMRHSDIRLTLERYGHLVKNAEADAIAKLRNVFTPNPQPLSVVREA